jgi:NET1-associated nuclear protein 1 (U3 small nucleolar RNA-associated protein 17)
MQYDFSSNKAQLLFQTSGCQGISYRKDYLASISGNRLSVWDFLNKKLRTHSWSGILYSVAIHPQENYIATGDQVGKIILWFCLGNSKEKSTTRIMHWHSHPVRSLAFTKDGVYLISAGEEV